MQEIGNNLRAELSDLGMREVRLGDSCQGGYLWTSHNIQSCGSLLAIIPGSGSEYPGPWSTVAFVSEVGIEKGSVLPYVRRAVLQVPIPTPSTTPYPALTLRRAI